MESLFQNTTQVIEFSRSLKTACIGKELVYLENTGSTNTLALNAGDEGRAHGTVFVANVQEAGRGRRGRSWETPPGLALLFSVLVRLEALQIDPSDSGWIALLAGWSSAFGIDSVLPLRPTIKWPNDLVIPCTAHPGWRKLGGILCESVLQAGDALTGYAVIGIGINVNHSAADLPITDKAPPTSIRLETGQPAERVEVFRSILEHLENSLNSLAILGRRDRLKADIDLEMARWWSPEQTLELDVGMGQQFIRGKYAGLDRFGRLRINVDGRTVELADGEILKVSTQE